MTAYILLPALTHAEHSPDHSLLDGTTRVLIASAATGPWQASRLQEALATQARSTVLLHPADAPLAVLTLPPLPAVRREAALRVVLEDRVLGDVQSLSFATLPLGAHRFAVAYCERTVLAAVQQGLDALGARSAVLGALAAHLPEGSHTIGDGWQLWADTQGAGALPVSANDADSDSDAHSGADTELTAAPATHWTLALKPSALKFVTPHAVGGTWARWRWATIAGLLCLTVALLGQYAYWRSLLAAQAQAQARINTAFSKALPNTPQVDALKQLQRAAHHTRETSPLAAALAQLPPEVGTGGVLWFEWRAGALTVVLNHQSMALSEAQKEAFTKRLQTNGIAVRWETPR